MGTIIRPGEVHVGDRLLAYTLVRVPRRRHVHLVMSVDGGLQVRAPYRFSLPQAEAAIREQAPWVLRSLAHAQDRRSCRPALQDGAELPFNDDRLRLQLNPIQQADLFSTAEVVEPGEVRRVGEALQVRTATGPGVQLVPLLRAWYLKQARAYLPGRLYELAERLGVRPARVSVRAQKTVWGSCSSTGGISLNWRLVLVPSALSDYVLIHELCHLRHLDHSRRFWQMVAEHVPDHRSRRKRLNTLQDSLAL